MQKWLAILLIAGTAGVRAQEPNAPGQKLYRIQEGYPVDAIQRLQSRTTTLQFRLGNAQAMVAQSVIKRVQVWHPTEMPLKVAFLGGSNELRTQIASTIRAWSANSGVSFDFGQPGAFHEWSRLDQTYQAQIRISFDEAGYWSWVGAESIDQSIAAPNQPSMNFGQFTEGLPDDWQGTVLHEFGHAIGFEHEHQSPAGDCDHEFRWDDDPGYVRTTDIYGQFVPDGAGKRPGIYSVLEGPPNNWSKDQIDFNLKSLPATIDLRFSVFDPASIMMYSFADWMFVNGAQSSCYTKENLTLSALDLKAAAETYPPEPSLGTVAQQDVAAARKLLLQKKLPAEVKAHLQERLAAFQ